MPQSKEPELKGEFYDEVILSCSAEGCTERGKDVFVDFRVLNHEPFFYVHAYGNSICEHMWKQAREDVDYEIEGFHEKSSAEIVSSVNQKIPKSSTVCPECGASLP